jgi:valyl-tRNA synthetase
MDKKDALIAQGRKIQWHPEFMVKRYESWVEGLNQDWCLSRQRYFGVPIPVWYKIDDVGRVQYDQVLMPRRDQLPMDPFDDVPDGYTEAQRDQPGGFTGDPDVMDTWATSSLTPQIASGWVDDPDRHAKLFPMDIRPQSHEIIRTWAFYTIVKAYLHEREVPWRHVVISGWILDPDRKKMSKSHGNVVTPEPLVDEYGADSVRYWAARARLGVDTAYDEQVFKVGKKLCTKLFNASKFAIGRFDGIDAAQLGIDTITAETDRAIIAELRPLIVRATKAFDAFDYAQALNLVEDFFWRTFCDNYLELAKARTYEEDLTPGRLSACATLRLLHRAVVRLLAPFVPYITEEIWSWEYSTDADMHASVHRSAWPTLDEFAAIPEPTHASSYATGMAVVEAVRKAKADANASMAAPVAEVTVRADKVAIAALHTMLDDIERMLKIERTSIEETATGNGSIEVTAKIAVG